MGMDLGFVSINKSVKVPEDFQWRFARRGEFWSQCWLGFASLYQCNTEWHKDKRDCDLGCLNLTRPAQEDFPALRKKMRELVLEPIFFEIVDWLEAHPDVYLEYS